MDLAVVVAENSLVVVLRLGQKDIGILSQEEDESWLLQEGWVPEVALTSPCESLLSRVEENGPTTEISDNPRPRTTPFLDQRGKPRAYRR